MDNGAPVGSLRLYKKEKLCSDIAIGQLFERDGDATSSIAFPLLVRWRVNPTRHGATCPRFLISVPKKRIRHAVDRVQMRRRIREAYRLSRNLIPADVPLDIVFTYVSDTVLPYAPVLKGMTRLLNRISRSLSHDRNRDS